jgi:hypothetical protein
MKWACMLCMLVGPGCAFELPRDAVELACGDAIAASHAWCERDGQCRTLQCDCVRFETLECRSIGSDGAVERVWCDESDCYR